MYITPELFQQAPESHAYEDSHHPRTQGQNLIAMAPENEHASLNLGKRKRQFHSHDDSVIPPQNSVHNKPSSSLASDAGDVSGTANVHSLPALSNPHPSRLRNPPRDEPPRKLVRIKRRTILANEASRTGYQKPACEPNESNPLSPSKGGNTLKACHLCHKRPMQKKDLDAFADCSRCQERTCFVCIRECSGSCGARRICRNCCVEKGEEGDTYCFECLGQSPDQEMED